jgi:hypothetical protein
MNMDETMKYILWAVLFSVALFGLYKLFGRLGVL